MAMGQSTMCWLLARALLINQIIIYKNYKNMKKLQTPRMFWILHKMFIPRDIRDEVKILLIGINVFGIFTTISLSSEGNECCSEDREAYSASDIRNCIAIENISLFRYERCKPLMEAKSFRSTSTMGWVHKGSEGTLLFVKYMAKVFVLLFLLVGFVNRF